MKLFAIYTCCAALALGAQAGGAAKNRGDAAKGKSTFDVQCAVCHAATSDEKKVGPSLKNLFKKAKMTNGKQPTEPNVRAVIDNGGEAMPGYKDMLSDEERNGVLAYLKTL
jgi:cytochrome c